MKELVEIAIQAGINASKAILEIYQEDFGVYQKEDRSPVTDADLKSTSIIESELSVLKLPIISEEKEIPVYSQRSGFNQFFMIDPLDGTKEFVGKTDEFCVNIALVENNEPTLGLIFNPLEQEFLVGGSYTNQVEHYDFNLNGSFSKRKSLEPAENRIEDEGIRLICSRRTDFERLKNNAQLLFPDQKIEIKTKGSALKFIDLALDRADYYLRYGKTMEWDIAPGFAILKQLNGSIDQFEERGPVKFNKENLLNPPFMAYNNK